MSEAFALDPSADSSASIDLHRFDLEMEGTITDGKGTERRRLSFNAYKVVECSFAARGVQVDQATLIHEAMKFMSDYLLVRREPSAR